MPSRAFPPAQALLRFFGYLSNLGRIPDGASLDMSLLGRPDLGDLAQAYASWLQTTQELRFSTIANYLNGLISVTTYAYANLDPPEATLLLEPTPLTQLINAQRALLLLLLLHVQTVYSILTCNICTFSPPARG